MIKSLFMTIVVALFVTACSSAVAPYATNAVVPNAEAKSSKSTCKWIFGFRVQSCSVDDALKRGDISQVQTINVESFNFLYLYRSYVISIRGK